MSADPWDTLDSQLQQLDFASKQNVTTPLDVSGDDDVAAHLDTLDDAADRVRDAWQRARSLDGAAKKKVQQLARGALDTAQQLATKAADEAQQLSPPSLAQHLVQRAEEVKDKLKQTAKDVLPWYLAIGVGAWLAIGVGAWVLWNANEKQRPERERVARERAA